MGKFSFFSYKNLRLCCIKSNIINTFIDTGLREGFDFLNSDIIFGWQTSATFSRCQASRDKLYNLLSNALTEVTKFKFNNANTKDLEKYIAVHLAGQILAHLTHQEFVGPYYSEEDELQMYLGNRGDLPDAFWADMDRNTRNCTNLKLQSKTFEELILNSITHLGPTKMVQLAFNGYQMHRSSRIETQQRYEHSVDEYTERARNIMS